MNYGISVMDLGNLSLELGGGLPCSLFDECSALLEMRCGQMNDILSRDRALYEIWKDNTYFMTRSMDVHIAKLRKYLSSGASIKIINVHGSGYRLMVPIRAE